MTYLSLSFLIRKMTITEFYFLALLGMTLGNAWKAHCLVTDIHEAGR